MTRLTTIEEKNFIVDLYLVGLGIKMTHIDAAFFAWLPEETVQTCQGKTDKECYRYYKDHYVMKVGSDEQITDYRQARLKQQKKKYPPEVLVDWVYDKHILEQLE